MKTSITSEPDPLRCPTCNGESFETEIFGHLVFEDHSGACYWYGTCQTCGQHLASSSDKYYVPTDKEWEEWVERPNAESALRKIEEDKLKEEQYRKYKWSFDQEWPFDTE
ncbi:hypothetical protein N8590_04205 [bacterium]|jgi:hypothetical protein|nr:hypothetical protein [Planctomicrobium sp.]MDA7528170.1 hypothetical protein [bacterium]MDB4802535.1 hypothetical protein [bacterium]